MEKLMADYQTAKIQAPELGIALPITANDDVFAQWIKATLIAGRTGSARQIKLANKLAKMA